MAREDAEPILRPGAWEGLQGAALVGVRRSHCPVLLCRLMATQQHCLLGGVCPGLSEQSRELLLLCCLRRRGSCRVSSLTSPSSMAVSLVPGLP